MFSGCALVTGPAAGSPFGMGCLYPLAQSPAGIYLACCNSALAPTGPAAPIRLDALTSDEEQQKIISRDPFRYDGDIMNKTAYEFLKLCSAAKEAIPYIKVPFICLHGSADEVTLPEGSDYLFEHTSTPTNLRQIIKFADLKHEIFHEREPDRTKVIAAVVSFIINFTETKSNTLRML